MVESQKPSPTAEDRFIWDEEDMKWVIVRKEEEDDDGTGRAGNIHVKGS